MSELPHDPFLRNPVQAEDWHMAVNLLLDIRYLENRAIDSRDVSGLVADFQTVIRQLPLEHPSYQRLRLVGEALHRERHFIARHPESLFQCLWNLCWWYDSSEAEQHYDPPEGGWSEQGPPWVACEPEMRVSRLLEQWRDSPKRKRLRWLRSLRPPEIPLGGSLQALLRGHDHNVNCVAWSADGRWIASGGLDNAVRIWDAETREHRRCLRGHDAQVRSISFSPDSSKIVSAADDGTVRIWDIETECEFCQSLTGHDGPVRAVAFASSGKQVGSGGDDMTIRIWSLGPPKQDVCCRGHNGRIRGIAFSPDGQRITSCAEDKTLRVWSVAVANELAVLHGHKDKVVTSVAFSPDGKLIASGSKDKTVRVWDATKNEIRHVLEGHSGAVMGVAFAPDGQRIASASTDRSVRVWDWETGRELVSHRGHTRYVEMVAFSPDGCHIVSASRDQTARIWDANDLRASPCLRGHSGRVNSVAFAPNGEFAISGSDDKTVCKWDTSPPGHAGRLIGRYNTHDNSVKCVAVSPDSRYIASASGDNTVRIRDLVADTEVFCFEGHGTEVRSVVFSPDGWLVASGGRGVPKSREGQEAEQVGRGRQGLILIWESQTGRIVQTLSGHEGSVTALAFSQDGEQLVSGSSDNSDARPDYPLDNSVRLWDLASGQTLHRLDAHRLGVIDVAFFADGVTIVSVARTPETIVWDTDSDNRRGIDRILDPYALAAGPDRIPWLARWYPVPQRAGETEIVSATTGEAVAWWSANLTYIETHPLCPIWAGAAGHCFALFRLEEA